MPRTKIKSKSQSVAENIKPTTIRLKDRNIKGYFKELEHENIRREEKIAAGIERLMLNFQSGMSEMSMVIPRLDLGKTLAELKRTEGSLSSDTMLNLRYTPLKTVTAENNQPSASNIIVPHLSRSRLPWTRAKSGKKNSKHNKRASRSLSRTKMLEVVQSNFFKTPMQEAFSFDIVCQTVTPKVNPHKPQVMMRRPQEGEMAISMQGSPLMVSSISTNLVANVNIPLQDGCILTIQPHRGLRTSQVPYLDEKTQRQIETLRDNLNKFCDRG